MVRRGWWLLAAVAVAGCGDDDGAPATTTTAEAAPPTLPADVEPGRGLLILDGQASVLTVTDCAFEPTTDEATGVTTVLTVAAQDAVGRTVDIVRSSFTADVPTTTDTITIADAGGAALESSRADRDGLQIDLRVPNAVGPLLDVDPGDGTVRATGVFGPVGGRPDDPANVEGELLLRCP
jgi:hypothetical protein